VNEPIQEEMVLNMVTSPCYGKCPVYNLKIYNTQKATIKGTSNFKWLGTYEKMLSDEEYSSIIAEFEESNFYAFDSIYPSEVADFPSVTISFKDKDQASFHTVLGKFERPEELIALEKLLENIAISDGWRLTDPLSAAPNALDEDNEDKSKIIIQPRDGIHLPNWFRKHREAYGVRIVSRVAPHANIWLITYDDKKISAAEMMDVLKADPDIKSAEFNKELEFRN